MSTRNARQAAWEATQEYLDGMHAGEPAREDYQPPPDDDGWTAAQSPPVSLDAVTDHASDAAPESQDAPVEGEADQSSVHPGPDLATFSPTETSQRYNKPLAVGSVITTGVLAILGSCGLWAMRTGPHVAADQTNENPTAVRVIAAPSPAPTVDLNQDTPIPYRATAHGCLPGSTAAQSVAGNDPNQAWVCATGGNHGQYVEFDLGKTTHVSAVAITAGWPGKDASGVDQWQQHLMPTKVQWGCDDVPPTVVTEQAIHPGEAITPFGAQGALCSKITMIVQETARTPAEAPTSSTATAPTGGPLDDILGPPSTTAPALPGEKPSSDPADNTFAVLRIKILGHKPS